MISYIICSHGIFAEAIRAAGEMIFGEISGVSCLGLLEGEDMIDFSERIKQQYEDDLSKGYQPIILTDIPNASPFNASILALAEYRDEKVITGINLPLLLELLIQQAHGDYETLDFEAIITSAREALAVTSVGEFLE